MTSHERRRRLANDITAGTTDLTVNGVPYLHWLTSNLADVIEADTFINLDEMVIMNGWADAVMVAVKWSTGAGTTYGNAEQIMLRTLRNRSARKWLHEHRDAVRKLTRESDDFLTDVIDAIIGTYGPRSTTT